MSNKNTRQIKTMYDLTRTGKVNILRSGKNNKILAKYNTQ
jgi:hypothetical protein